MTRFYSRYAKHTLKTPAGTIRFENNVFVTENEAFIEYLRRHPDYGILIFEDKNPEVKKARKRIDEAV